jgi:hypothetical protein
VQRSVVCMLDIVKLLISKIRMFVAVMSKKMNHGLTDHLYLSFNMWMENNTPLQLGVHELP